jgi:hypothetical protein
MTKYRWDEKGEAGRQDYGFRMTVRLYPAIRRTPMKTVISEDKRQFTISLDLGDKVWLSGRDWNFVGNAARFCGRCAALSDGGYFVCPEKPLVPKSP